MKHKNPHIHTVKIDFSGDKPQYYVNTDFHIYYMEFVLRAFDEIKKENNEDNKIKPIIQFIIWSALYLEALINNNLLRLLEHINNNQSHSNAIWESVQRIRTINKLDLLFKLIGIKVEKSNVTFVEQLFKTRNRLAHFKESPSEVRPKGDAFHENHSIGSHLDCLSNPKIINDLLEINIDEYKEKIISLGDLITKENDGFLQEKHIHLRDKTILNKIQQSTLKTLLNQKNEIISFEE